MADQGAITQLRQASAQFVMAGRMLGYAQGVRAAATRLREARAVYAAQLEAAIGKLSRKPREATRQNEQRWLDALAAQAATLEQVATAQDAQAAQAQDVAHRLMQDLEALLPGTRGAGVAERVARAVGAARRAWTAKPGPVRVV